MSHRLVIVVLVAAILAIGGGSRVPAAPVVGCGGSYGWPVRPFGTLHPVRGYFDDPRILRSSHTFHFGIDIAAPSRTPVYAVEEGMAHVHRDSVAVVASDERRTFSYWHIVPTVRDHSVVSKHDQVGFVSPYWNHVHFAEMSPGYCNPLRPGALTPWVDTRAPVVRAIDFVHGGRRVSRQSLRGSVDVVTNAYDLPSITVAPPWTDMPVTPALLRWRVLRGARVVQGWRVSVDFRRRLLPGSAYNRIYAPGTRQNRRGRPGRYMFFLAKGWSTRLLPDGEYVLQVEAVDTRGNVGERSRSVVIANIGSDRLT